MCLISTGNMLSVAVDAASMLANQNISAQVVSLHTIKPLDTELLNKIFSSFKQVVSLEEHSLIGGLGSALAEWMVDAGISPSCLTRFGTPDQFFHASVSQNILREKLGLTPQHIVNTLCKQLQRF